ncbi:MAG: chemotaxis protein CheA [Myxococcales bacterium]|nr:chemotaxis protein CheA [Myxococcales bacterium]
MSQSEDDRARAEFLAEAQEIVEALSRDLLVLEDANKRGLTLPETVNDVFRGVHTLKGLAGMFSFERIAELAHVFEDLLEALRLGRVPMDGGVLDLLFEGAEGFQHLLAGAQRSDAAVDVDVEGLLARIAALEPGAASQRDILSDYDIDPNILSVLTEYEEHRLRSSFEQGRTVYRFRLQLALDAIDTSLAGLKERCSGVAEVLSYLPSSSAEVKDAIEIELLIATRVSPAELRETLDRPDGLLIPIERKRRDSIAPRMDAEAGMAAASLNQAAPEVEPSEDTGSLRSLANVVRVDIGKLDHLMNVVGELGSLRSSFVQLVERLRAHSTDRELIFEAQRIQRGFQRHLGEVQSSVLGVRMVPLSQLFDKLAVIVRQLARDQGKEVQLVVKGAETEVDKLIAEEIADPLMHIVRNAIDHGIESRDERERLDKPKVSNFGIRAFPRGNHVVIELRDDGRGIDPSLVRETAVRRGVLSEHEVGDMTPEDLMEVIFRPGFSTREVVTGISGRGVGMDVVKTNINRLGGAVEIASELGRGTTFTITLPVTLAIISALLFQTRGRVMAISLSAVREALRFEDYALRTVEGREVLDLRGETLPLCRLAELFGLSDGKSVPERMLRTATRRRRVHGGEAQQADDAEVFSSEPPVKSRSGAGFVIVIVVGNRRLGLVVDRLLGQQDIVIKPLGRSLSSVPGISGATDLGDQRLVLVVDAPAIIDEALLGRWLRPSLGGQA